MWRPTRRAVRLLEDQVQEPRARQPARVDHLGDVRSETRVDTEEGENPAHGARRVGRELVEEDEQDLLAGKAPGEPAQVLEVWALRPAVVRHRLEEGHAPVVVLVAQILIW